MPVTMTPAQYQRLLDPASPKAQRTRRPKRSVSQWRNERQFMAAVIAQCDALAATNPVYGRVYHISNENSHRQPGVRAGVPDLALDVARYNPETGSLYHGWRCELKIEGGALSPAQLDWRTFLLCEGYYACVIWERVGDVIDNLTWYLALPVHP